MSDASVLRGAGLLGVLSVLGCAATPEVGHESLACEAGQVAVDGRCVTGDVNRIMGGARRPARAYREVGLLVRDLQRNGRASSACAATLVGPSLAITSANCAGAMSASDDWRVFFGRQDDESATAQFAARDGRFFRMQDEAGIGVRVIRAEVRPSGSHVLGVRDFTLLTLEQPVSDVTPAKVTRVFPRAAWSVRVVGFHAYNELVRTVADAPLAGLDHGTPPRWFDAGSMERGATVAGIPCGLGDEGAAVFADDGGERVLLGLAAVGCAQMWRGTIVTPDTLMLSDAERPEGTDVAPPVEQAPAGDPHRDDTAEPISDHAPDPSCDVPAGQCGECTALAACGYCATDGGCRAGSADGPRDGACAGDDWKWIAETCE